jgi:hypothetical protein
MAEMGQIGLSVIHEASGELATGGQHPIDVGPAGLVQSGNLSKGALNQRWRKATELALDEPSKGNRTAIFQVPAK